MARSPCLLELALYFSSANGSNSVGLLLYHLLLLTILPFLWDELSLDSSGGSSLLMKLDSTLLMGSLAYSSYLALGSFGRKLNK